MEIQIGQWRIKRTTDGRVLVLHRDLSPDETLSMTLDEWQRMTCLLAREPIEEYDRLKRMGDALRPHPHVSYVKP